MVFFQFSIIFFDANIIIRLFTSEYTSLKFSAIDTPVHVLPDPVPWYINILLYGVLFDIKFFKNNWCGCFSNIPESQWLLCVNIGLNSNLLRISFEKLMLL